MKFKQKLQQRHEILDVLAGKDKEELKKASYVAYNDVIEFPQPVAFTIKRLKGIIKEVEKAKLKGDKILCGVMIEIPIPEELQKKFGKKRKITGVKSVKKDYRKLK